MEECIFCKIAKGEIPCDKIYEDEKFLVFLDISPLNPGHSLVIPKKHYMWVWDVENIDEYYKVVQRIANAQKKAFNTDLVVSIVIGEEVKHAHVWLIPRFSNDGHGTSINLSNRKEYSKEEMEKFRKRIEDNL